MNTVKKNFGKRPRDKKTNFETNIQTLKKKYIYIHHTVTQYTQNIIHHKI